MGMYDTVLVPCPACNVRAEFQSKSGACELETYLLDEAPDDVLLGVNRHSPSRCVECGTLFGVEVSTQRPRRTLFARPIVWTEEKK